MRKTAWVVMSVLCLGAISGLAGEQPRVAPPPLRQEAQTLRPSPAHVWIPGYWKWASFNYQWVDGRWVKAKPNRIWVPGVWEPVGNRWVWKPGHWEKVKADGLKADNRKKDGPSAY
jgi:hypothetical protein